jgi:hypothetical protein
VVACIILVLLSIYYVLVLIVLVNLLIAIVSRTFKDVKRTEEAHMLRNYAAIIVELEIMMSEQQCKELHGGALGRFVHVLEPQQAAGWLRGGKGEGVLPSRLPGKQPNAGQRGGGEGAGRWIAGRAASMTGERGGSACRAEEQEQEQHEEEDKQLEQRGVQLPEAVVEQLKEAMFQMQKEMQEAMLLEMKRLLTQERRQGQGDQSEQGGQQQGEQHHLFQHAQVQPRPWVP